MPKPKKAATPTPSALPPKTPPVVDGKPKDTPPTPIPATVRAEQDSATTEIIITEKLRTSAQSFLQASASIDWEDLRASGVREIRFRFSSALSAAAFRSDLDRCLSACPSQAPFCPQYPIFTGADFADINGLVAQLKQPTNAPSHWLAGEVNEVTRSEVAQSQDTHPVPSKLRAGLIKAIIRLLEGPSIYEPERFQGVTLDADTRQLLNRQPRGFELVTLNRLLLEAAFPSAITAAPSFVEVAVAAFDDLTAMLIDVADLMAKSHHDQVPVKNAELRFPGLFWKTFNPANYLFAEAQVAPELASLSDPADHKTRIEELLTSARDFAGGLESATATQTDPSHHISIVVSEAGKWEFKDGATTLHLGSSAQRCLMTLAILQTSTIRLPEFERLYVGKASGVKNQQAAKTFDNAGKALKVKLPRFAWEAVSGARTIKGLHWGALADEKAMRAHLNMLAPS